VAGSCEHGNHPSGPVNLLRKTSSPVKVILVYTCISCDATVATWKWYSIQVRSVNRIGVNGGCFLKREFRARVRLPSSHHFRSALRMCTTRAGI
jgi:hypothetical protein